MVKKEDRRQETEYRIKAQQLITKVRNLKSTKNSKGFWELI